MGAIFRLRNMNYHPFSAVVELVAVYECLCDRTRLRLLNLLRRGPLCVCHLQALLDEPQVKVSKHLGYLKQRGMLTVSRSGNWRIYALVDNPPRALEANLACLQDIAAEDPQFRDDLKRLEQLQAEWAAGDACCAPEFVRDPRLSST